MAEVHEVQQRETMVVFLANVSGRLLDEPQDSVLRSAVVTLAMLWICVERAAAFLLAASMSDARFAETASPSIGSAVMVRGVIVARPGPGFETPGYEDADRYLVEFQVRGGTQRMRILREDMRLVELAELEAEAVEMRITELEAENDQLRTQTINRFVLQPNHEVIAAGEVFKVISRPIATEG